MNEKARPARAGFFVPFALVLALLAGVTASALTMTGPSVWLVGFLYIGYDTWLLFFVAARTRGCLAAPAAAPAAAGPSVAALIAARNEALVLPQCLAALRAQTSPPDEVFVVDDGSDDGTRAALEAAAWPGLRVLAKEHTGKSDSLNRALAQLRSEVVVTIDADTLLEPGAIAAVRAAFAAEPQLAAACGVLTPRCRPAALGPVLEAFQVFEYIRAFLAREAWMREGTLLLVSGAFAAYRRETLVSLGGYDPRSLVEDYDLIHRLHRWAYDHGADLRVSLVSGARAVTDAPATLRALLKQRLRWFGGFLQTQFKYRDMVGNPRYGRVGTLMLPVKTIDTLQPVFGLVAFATLVGLIASGRGIHGLILWVIALKLALDLCFHFWFVYLYHRWQGRPFAKAILLKSMLVTLAEPVSFQLLRHAGAVLGWLSFLSGANDWTPQRGTSGGS